MAVIVVQEMDKIVKATSLAVYGDETKINFIHGDETQTVQKLKDLDPSIRYPCIALLQPFDENDNGGNLLATFPRLIIATITDSTNPPNVRYNETFIPILYPIFEMLWSEISSANTIAESLEEKIIYETKRDVPGSVPAAEDLKDYLDTIEIYKLKLHFFTNNCQ